MDTPHRQKSKNLRDWPLRSAAGEGLALAVADYRSIYPSTKDKHDFAVVVYLIMRHMENTLYVEARLKLSSDSFQVNCSNTNGSNENIILEWATADIIHIESHWSERVDATLVKFFLNGK